MKLRINLKKYLCVAIFIAIFSLSSFDATADQDHHKRVKGLSFYAVGVIYDLQGATIEAIELFKAAAEYEDTYAVHLRLGAGYARLGKLSQAIDELYLVLDQDPANVQARYLLALIYSTQKDFDKAAEQYEEILTSFSEADPENIEIYGYLGHLYYSQKQYKKAIDQYEVILSFYPNSTDVLFMLGSLYLEIKEQDRAVELFLKAVQIDPHHDTSLNSLGYIYAEDGSKLDEAQTLIERALQIDPENGAYLDSLGWVYYKKGNYDQALIYLKKADKLIKDPVIYEHLGDVYSKLNQQDAAVKYWKLSLDLLPDQKHIVNKIKSSEKEIEKVIDN